MNFLKHRTHDSILKEKELCEEQIRQEEATLNKSRAKLAYIKETLQKGEPRVYELTIAQIEARLGYKIKISKR